jgi:hypothetical protein
LKKKDAYIGFRVDARIKAAAERAASEDSRSLGSLLEKLLLDFLKQNKFIANNNHGANHNHE